MYFNKYAIYGVDTMIFYLFIYNRINIYAYLKYYKKIYVLVNTYYFWYKFMSITLYKYVKLIIFEDYIELSVYLMTEVH